MSYILVNVTKWEKEQRKFKQYLNSNFKMTFWDAMHKAIYYIFFKKKWAEIEKGDLRMLTKYIEFNNPSFFNIFRMQSNCILRLFPLCVKMLCIDTNRCQPIRIYIYIYFIYMLCVRCDAQNVADFSLVCHKHSKLLFFLSFFSLYFLG